MKLYLLILLFTISTNIFAVTQHNCIHADYNFNIITDQEKDISLEVFKEKNKLMECSFKVTSYNDGKMSASTSELMRFEKLTCNLIDDQIDSKIEVIEKGFVKVSNLEKASYAYIVKNVQPLKCKYK